MSPLLEANCYGALDTVKTSLFIQGTQNLACLSHLSQKIFITSSRYMFFLTFIPEVT